MSLWHQFRSNTDRAIHKWGHYFPIYERHFQRYLNRPLLFVEIGCGEGGSLQMWKKYFGPDARIVGIDIRPECAAFEEPQISVRIGDQVDADFLASIVAEFGSPDIVLDDGSHMMDHIKQTFSFLYPRTSPTGVYMVEDLHTAYWPEYGGGLRNPTTFIEQAKELIDQLNQHHAPNDIPVTEFSRTTASIHFYDSIIAFEKAPVGARYPIMIPQRPARNGG